RVLAGRRAPDAGARAARGTGGAGPVRHHDRGGRRDPARRLRRPVRGGRHGDLPAGHRHRRGRAGTPRPAPRAAGALSGPTGAGIPACPGSPRVPSPSPPHRTDLEHRGAMSRTIDIDAYAEGVLAGHRPTLARAITLVESRRADHAELAQQLLVRLLPHSGKAHRVGVTGVPGVGKSTFIDSLGSLLTGRGHRVAVLAVDPSSVRTGGSILGDKTRMARLSADPNAFVRPSPSAGTLGGVARATRETMVLMEAAGFDVVL